MSRCVVIGGGLGGLAVAARLAKQGHRVCLVERRPVLGGALGRIEQDGFTWDAGPPYLVLPAALRDLFRKTGRPIERELELQPLDILREHRFADGSTLALPGGSRGAQLRAFDALGPAGRSRLGRGRRDLGRQWVDHVASYDDDWEVLRSGYLEEPWQPDDLPRDLAARLDGRETLHRRLRRALSDERLRQVAAYPFTSEGHDPRLVPAWAGLVAYLEQRFGGWRVSGGMAALGDALAARLATRGVRVHTGLPARDVVVRRGRAVGVRTDDGVLDADVVVCAVDPRLLPALAVHVEHTVPALPPPTCHVGLDHPRPDLTGEVVLHARRPGEPMLVVRPGSAAPESTPAGAYTVLGRGQVGEDLLTSLAHRGVDLRPGLATRLDLSPRDQVERWGSSPLGVLWQGRGTVRRRLGPRTPVPGVYACGAHATPASAGAGAPMVALSAALVAQVIGPA